MFLNRKEAGEKLSIELEKFKADKPIVLAIPRGGILTAYETIKRLGFEWDLIIPRKIGLPQNKEIAIGAISLDETSIFNEKYISMLGIPQEYINNEISEQIEEIKRRLLKYKGNSNYPNVKNKTVIIIDDGIATGSTIQVAIKSIRKHEPSKIVLAVPVAPKDTISMLDKIVDETICLITPEEFYAVGPYYKNFEQVTDEEVIGIVLELRNKDKRVLH